MSLIKELGTVTFDRAVVRQLIYVDECGALQLGQWIAVVPEGPYRGWAMIIAEQLFPMFQYERATDQMLDRFAAEVERRAYECTLDGWMPEDGAPPRKSVLP